MLQAKTEEQKKQIIKMIGLCETCCNFSLNYEEEIGVAVYNEYRDRIYIDGTVTFDIMADIVDYLRASDCKNRMLAKLEAHKQKIDYYYANQTIFFQNENDAEKNETFIKSLGDLGYDVDTLMDEYNKTGKITI